MRPNCWSDRSFEDDVPGYVRAITDHILRTKLAQSDKKIVEDRTPHHVVCLHEIHDLYPASKVIRIIQGSGRSA